MNLGFSESVKVFSTVTVPLQAIKEPGLKPFDITALRGATGGSQPWVWGGQYSLHQPQPLQS